MFNKTRKRGGNIVYRCPKPGNKNNCIKSYLEVEDIKLTHIPPDGDCFFNSIATYFKSKGINVTHMHLREKVIEYMEAHREEYIPFFIVESNKPSIIKATMTRQFNQLKKSGAWNNQLADFIPQEAPKALDINIRLHEINDAGTSISVHILRDDNKNLNTTERYPTIDVLRINRNHYELLTPMRSVNESSSKIHTNKTKTIAKAETRKNRIPSLTQNEINAFEKQFRNIQIQQNEEYARKIANQIAKEENAKKKEREEKIRLYAMKKEERNAETKKKANNAERLIKEYERLLESGAFNQ